AGGAQACDHHLPPALVGQAEDARLEHARARLEHRLDLRGRDVLAAADDDVVGAPEHVQLAVRVDAAAIARAEAPRRVDGDVAARPDVPAGQGRPEDVDDAVLDTDLDARQGHADAAALLERRARARRGDLRA